MWVHSPSACHPTVMDPSAAPAHPNPPLPRERPAALPLQAPLCPDAAVRELAAELAAITTRQIGRAHV